LNAANEIAVAAFLYDQVGFLEMSDLIEACMKTVHFIQKPTLDDYMHTDKETRRRAAEWLRLESSLFSVVKAPASAEGNGG
jgi:1-deoxy-D-xylulose-5-phosphate reductoisomerase